MQAGGVDEARSGGRLRGVSIAVIGFVAIAVIAAVAATFAMRSDGPAVIRLAGGGPGGDALTATAESADDMPMRGEMGLWNPVTYQFELRDGARIDAGEATAWRLEPPSDLESAATAMAEHFGLGAVRSAPYGDGSLIAGSDDGTEPTLWISPTGEWSFHSPGGRILWDCVEPALPEPEIAEDLVDDPDTPVSDDDVTSSGDLAADDRDSLVDPGTASPACEPPTPPSGVPSAAEARSLAEALFRDLDIPGEVTIEGDSADEWGAWVHGGVVVDGVRSELFVSAGWGGDAELVAANSTFARPTRADTYPTIDAERAVERLEGQAGGSAALTRLEPLPAVEDDPAVTTPLPEDVGEPEVVTVTLVSVEPVLMLQWDTDGSTWLLPGYRFTDEDGGIWQVLAIADEYLETDVPAEPEPAPEPDPAPEPAPEPGPDGQGSTGAGSDPEPGEVEPSEPGDGRLPDDAEPTPGPDEELIERFEALAEAVIGLSEGDATERIEGVGGVVRVVARDGESFPVTDDFSTSRINLTVEDQVVVEATVG